MKNKGFTLVEMLAVVVILSLLGVIGIVSVESIIKKGTEKSYQAQMSEIKMATENLVKIDGEPTWCEDEEFCFVSLRYLVFRKYIKLNENGEYINPKTDKPFSLEMVSLIKKYGGNYIIESYDSIEKMTEIYPSYLNKAKEHVLAASATIYKSREYCSGVCNLRTSNLVEKGLLSEGFYNEVNITINEENKVYIG